MNDKSYILKRLARYTGPFAIFLGISVAFLWLNIFLQQEKDIYLNNTLSAVLYLPLLLFPFVMSGVVASMRTKTVSSIAFFGTVLGFVLMVLALTGLLYSLPFWTDGGGDLVIFIGAIAILLGFGILGLTALRSKSGVHPALGFGLLLIPLALLGLFLARGMGSASILLAAFHGTAFILIGLVLTFSKNGKVTPPLPKWTLSVAVPAFLISLSAFVINVSAPHFIAQNYIQEMSGTDLPPSMDNFHIENKPVFGLGDWMVFEAPSEDVKEWLESGPDCWRNSMKENGKTEFFNPELKGFYDFWAERKLPERYSAAKCTKRDPQSYIMIDQSDPETWTVYLNIWED